MVFLWCGRTAGGRCTVTWLPNFLGWVDLLTMGLRARVELRYDVMKCSMRNYYFTSVWVSVSGSGADSVLCSLFGILYFHLGIYLSVSGFGFSILLLCFFLGFCTSISEFWVFVLYYRQQGKLSVFFKLYVSILYFVILVLVLPLWNLCFCFRFRFSFLCIFLIGHHIFDRLFCVNLSTGGSFTRWSISWHFR